VSWNTTVGPSGVHDYEIGLATDNTSFPDILPFQSTKQHAFSRLFHPEIWDGDEFYILIQVTSKSSVSNIKVDLSFNSKYH